jgi:L-malate glycosyltransferase
MSANKNQNISLAICSAGEIYGGVEQFIYIFSKYLRQTTDINCIVILFNNGLLYEKLKAENIETYIIPRSFKYDFTVIKKITRLFRERNINIVHTHGYKANILCGISAKLIKAKVVKTEHGRQEPSTGLGSLKMSFNLAMDRLFTKYFCEWLVFVSKDIQRHFDRSYANKKQCVIYNGIEPISVSESTSTAEIDDKYFNIGIIGRITEVKGHLYLLKAMTILNHINDLRLYIFGEGPLKIACEDYCNSNGFTGKVYFMGFKNNIYDYMSKLDLLVMPSLHEGLPYTILEAMYLKVPIIASDVGGLKEILDNNIDAVLILPTDEESLANKIKYLYDNRKIKENLVTNAFKKVLNNFLMDNMAYKYKQIYRDCI